VHLDLRNAKFFAPAGPEPEAEEEQDADPEVDGVRAAV
jgi:hypothetical protein